MLLTVFVVSASLCQGADITFINNSGKKVYLAFSWYEKVPPGPGGNSSTLAVVKYPYTIVNGWHEIQPGASRTFGKGGGEFYYCITHNGEAATVEKFKPKYFWVHPKDAFRSAKEERESGIVMQLILGTETAKEQEAMYNLDSVQWGRSQKKTYSQYEYDHKLYSNESIKKFQDSGFKAYPFYQVPEKAERITINPIK